MEQRPLERRASVRTAVVWEACRAHLEAGSEQTVVDIGGGTGGFAVRVAELGHRVTVIDPNPDALAALGRRAAEHGVADRVDGQQGDLASLAALVPASTVDVVLCHEVLGLVQDPTGALGAIREVLRPGGTISLLVNQRHSGVLARAMAGQFDQALGLLQGGTTGDRRFEAAEITEVVRTAGFTLTSLHGVRVFADLVPSTLLDLEPGAVASLLELERAASVRPEYFAWATQLHLLATA